ncbi:flagellar basal body P-ring formation chaperone FlgA [Sphingobium boeckii]|uniref:Flagella basal body P-ring formation protein FlgA n=1 Tax=Sphingobium boeckii TaxID=1082345 RepID=A0A7W9EDG4_9SPHN|nr:flagellar basal body P-ring formation chaperone FlgA [Sphingobium boeckii]MBB5685263.1 flagella basal body P-ring formation protein FlgA [Sphingobium boeckii]
MRCLIATALLAASPAYAEPSGSALVETPVLIRAIERGEPLAASDFEMKPASRAIARGALTPPDAAGKEAARRLLPGSVVRQGDLVRPQVVRRGDAILLTVRSDGLSITTAGRALSGGGVGEAVRVVNLQSNRTLNGIIEHKGRVRIAALWEDK